MADGLGTKSVVEGKLTDELERLKRRVGMGHEVEVRWFPGATKQRDVPTGLTGTMHAAGLSHPEHPDAPQ